MNLQHWLAGKQRRELATYIDILDRTVGDSVGHRLAAVTYWTFIESTPRSAVLAGAGWLYGEVALEFEGSRQLFLGWAEDAQSADHFSLLPSLTAMYKPGTVVDVGALDAPEWLPVRNQPLLSGELLGANGAPHVLVLRFANGAGVCIGDGHGEEFGGGDQMLIHALPEPQLLRFPEMLLRAAAAN